ATGDCPIVTFTCENGLAFARRVDRDSIQNIRVDPNQMVVAQIVWFGVENLFDPLGQRINEPTRREPRINLILFFLRYGADLQHLPLVFLAKYLDRSADLNLLVFLLFLTKQRDRPTWLRQTVGIQVAAIIGYKLLNRCRRNLRNQVTDLLLISERAECRP